MGFLGKLGFFLLFFFRRDMIYSEVAVSVEASVADTVSLCSTIPAMFPNTQTSFFEFAPLKASRSYMEDPTVDIYELFPSDVLFIRRE